MADENHFVLYTDYQELFNELSDDLGKFWLPNIFSFVNDENL
jgi:hypothetical protein